jgi:16S rRNA (guanine(1405)-N(7))-methyltransferase
MSDHPDLENLIAEVRSSSKYRLVSPELVRVVAMRELAAHRRIKDAIKETKNKLHQIGGSFLEPKMDYSQWLAELTEAASDPTALRATCLRVLRHHASTRERLGMLDRFYADVFALLPPIESVLDLACGLNPLTRPWMPLAANATYLACDIYADMVAFAGQFLALTNTPNRTWVCDLVTSPPTEPADLVLALKLLPVLEQIEKGSALRLLKALNTAFVLVSFPAQSLGGRSKGMPEHYERMLRTMVAEEPWQLTRLSFASELAFLIRKS